MWELPFKKMIMVHTENNVIICNNNPWVTDLQ